MHRSALALEVEHLVHEIKEAEVLIISSSQRIGTFVTNSQQAQALAGFSDIELKIAIQKPPNLKQCDLILNPPRD